MDDEPRMDLRGTKIVKMVRNRNIKVLITAIIVFAIGVIFLTSAIKDMNYWGALVTFIVSICGCYGFYLFIKRTLDPYNHPDVKKFLRFRDSNSLITSFEDAIKDRRINGFLDTGYISDNFIIIEKTYRFRWIYYTEIVWAYINHTNYTIYHVIPAGTQHGIVIHLNNGEMIEVTLANVKLDIQNYCGPIDDKLVLSVISRMAPFAYYGYSPELVWGWEHERKKFIARVAENRINSNRGNFSPDAAVSNDDMSLHNIR